VAAWRSNEDESILVPAARRAVADRRRRAGVVVTAFQITMKELAEAVTLANADLASHAEFIESSDFDFTCPTWSRWWNEHQDALAAQSEAECRAEMAVPQHLLW
jgi:hypothetical protein